MTESSLERAVKLVLALFAQGPAEYEDVIRNCDDILALRGYPSDRQGGWDSLRKSRCGAKRSRVSQHSGGTAGKQREWR